MTISAPSLDAIQSTFSALSPTGATLSSADENSFALQLAEAENDVATLDAGPSSLGASVAMALGDDTPASLLDPSGGTDTTPSLSSLLSTLEADQGGGASTADEVEPTEGASDGAASAGPVSGDSVVAAAAQYLGTPYVWGGESPAGFDCSGLVQYVYGQLGVSLPRTSEEQATAGVAVDSLADAQPGDLVFFAGSDGTASSPGHVGIYIGDDKMIDAPETGEDVQVQSIDPSQVVAVRDVLGASALSSSASSPPGTTQMGNVAVPNEYASTIEQAAAAHDIPASLLAALLQTESGFNPDAVSSAGAEGIAQFMPATAQSNGVDPFDPTSAINGAATLLGNYTAHFGSYADALAAYNAGAGAVELYGGVPPYAQTQAYVPEVLRLAGLPTTSTGGVS